MLRSHPTSCSHAPTTSTPEGPQINWRGQIYTSLSTVKPTSPTIKQVGPRCPAPEEACASGGLFCCGGTDWYLFAVKTPTRTPPVQRVSAGDSATCPRDARGDSIRTGWNKHRGRQRSGERSASNLSTGGRCPEGSQPKAAERGSSSWRLKMTAGVEARLHEPVLAGPPSRGCSNLDATPTPSSSARDECWRS